MRPVLLELAGPSPLVYLGLFLLVAVGVGIWLFRLHRNRHAVTRDHLYVGAATLGMAALLLFILHRAGHIEVRSYGVMLMLGFVGGTFTAIRLGIRRGVATERFIDLGLVILLGAIIGARWMYLAITPQAGPFIDIHTILQEGLGGLSFHGGLIGGSIAGSLYIFAAKLPYWRVADCLAPGIALGYAITRIGCFLNGCCYGKSAVGLPWAVSFPVLQNPVFDVHPAQIYASLMGFTMFTVLVLLSQGKSLGRAGRLLMVFLILEGVERFVMEIYRQPDPNFSGVITPAQLLSIVLVIVGIIGLFALPKRPAVDERRPFQSPKRRDRKTLPASS